MGRIKEVYGEKNSSGQLVHEECIDLTNSALQGKTMRPISGLFYPFGTRFVFCIVFCSIRSHNGDIGLPSLLFFFRRRHDYLIVQLVGRSRLRFDANSQYSGCDNDAFFIVGTESWLG